MDEKFVALKERLKRDRETAFMKRQNDEKEKKSKKSKSCTKVKITKEESDLELEKSNKHIGPTQKPKCETKFQNSDELKKLLAKKREIELEIQKLQSQENQQTTDVGKRNSLLEPPSSVVVEQKTESEFAKLRKSVKQTTNNSKKIITKVESKVSDGDSIDVTRKPPKMKVQNKQTNKQRPEVEKQRTRERVRKHRSKLTVDKLEEKRRKDRERYKFKKENGLIKSISDSKEREQRKRRRDWKAASKRYRQSKSMQRQTIKYLDGATPPNSSDEELNPAYEQDVLRGLPKQRKGRKKVKSNRTTAYKYKKRLYRLKTLPSSKPSNSPGTKVKKMTRGLRIPTVVRKRLLFGEVLQQQLKENKQTVRSHKDKQVIGKLLSGEVLRKYKLVGHAKELITYKMHKKQVNSNKMTQYEKKQRNSVLMSARISKIKEFLERDENSKMCPGKKEYIKKNKVKKQRRTLLFPLYMLHKKFIQEKKNSIAYSTFCRLKPFWVVQPKKQDRETCACVKHANIELIVEKLFFQGIIPFKRAEGIIQEIVCSVDNRECMFNTCSTCKNRKYVIKSSQSINLDEIIEFQQWESVTEEKTIKNTKKTIRKTVKKKNSSTIKDVLNLLNVKLIEYQKHVFIMKHQITELQNKKQNIGENEVVFQIDFAENYITKYAKEIQSMHFGASKRQLSLHTGVYYTNNSKRCFCSVSGNLDHQAHGVWAHLNKILVELASQLPDLHNINFFSDGPTSQYRNRSNIYSLLTIIPSIFNNIQNISWNYSASGHGKGPMDGVGGALKRAADNIVSAGRDITSASSFVNTLKTRSSILLWEVPEENIHEAKELMPATIPPIPKIMSVHQVTWSQSKPSYIFLRELSCFDCSYGSKCKHYEMKSSEICFLLGRSLQTQTDSRNKIKILSNTVIKPRNSHSCVEIIKSNTAVDFTCNSEKKSSKIIFLPGRNLQINNDYKPGSLCFICTFPLTASASGLKCSTCSRTYHFKCIAKQYYTQEDGSQFLCRVCAGRK